MQHLQRPSVGCTAAANEAVANDRPRRGLLGAVVSLPFDVTGAVLTGYTTYDLRKKRVYDRAYANCLAQPRVANVTTSNFSGYSSDWMESCAARYRSFDPVTGTYVTYDGRVVACR